MKRAVISSDELNYHGFPGETAVFNETFGRWNFTVHRE
jgi:hypothetical protein